MSKKLLLNSLGKVFLLIGIFAVSGVGQAKAQLKPLVCTEYGGCLNWRCSKGAIDPSNCFVSSCRCIKQNSCSGDDNNCDRYSYYEATCAKTFCTAWAIDSSHFVSASQIATNMTPVDADVLLKKMNSTQFKNKIISSIPDKDTQFKAKIMTVLPLNELAEMYDPNKIYQ